jgi:hypothetical protein
MTSINPNLKPAKFSNNKLDEVLEFEKFCDFKIYLKAKVKFR